MRFLSVALVLSLSAGSATGEGADHPAFVEPAMLGKEMQCSSVPSPSADINGWPQAYRVSLPMVPQNHARACTPTFRKQQQIMTPPRYLIGVYR